jgi:hypothetical protein
MPKAQCWWCDTPTTNSMPKHGMIYLHKECFNEITDMNQSLESILQYMKGYRPKHEKDYPTIEVYIQEMKDFQRRWKNTQELIKKLSNPETVEKKLTSGGT